jgi:putative heme-binding domain-containing protein
MKLHHFLPVAALFAPAALAAAPFELQPGDRVLFMGDTLLEREGSAAALETLLTRRFADVPFTVRNLSFSADLPTGVSRASFDPAAAGMERIRTQLDLVKPTVAVLGYGMAASLEELTYRSGDPNLNADPTRYGSGFSVQKFKADLAVLMDAIAAASGGKPVRFVLLAPLRHEDLRATRPGLPDPATHNALLAAYTQAIRELASERGARFVDQAALLQQTGGAALTDNGIHPSATGLDRWAAAVAAELGWAPAADKAAAPGLQKALQRKNELFFHRWRPANHTYIFGFRKREQGRNAVEIEQFDALIEKADAAVAALKAGKPAPPEAVLPADIPAEQPVEAPVFQLEDGLEISLWAANPLLSKPVEMNWDAKGRLWVASTPIYPQIQPGAYATDKVFILEDTARKGRADKTTVFSDDLLIPTGVEPDLTAEGRNAAYVGASTELLLLTDTDGDGKADQRRIVLSGFGTEDTHHTLHSLHWGVDGRLYVSQSIYIHTHAETPWGVVRLNAGGVLAYDPRTEKVEVFAKGLVNNWGHQTDAEGQSFLTDGAGSNGVSWAFPGATFAPSEGAKGTMPSVSAGGYPKFCSLEIIRSPLFPSSWQGNAITNDFRAHRMVRFSFADLSKAEPARSAYATSDMPDVARTPDQGFRPVDVKLGPDGALYVADWTNPVINHGEVDFRDPRRDKKNGRIWRISHKDGKPVAWNSLWEKETAQLLDGLLSQSAWEQQQARRVLNRRLAGKGFGELDAWRKAKGTQEAERAAAFVRAAVAGPAAALDGLAVKEAATACWEARWRGALGPVAGNLDRLAALAVDASPRVRVEAMRALSRIPSTAAGEAVAAAVEKQPANDPQYAFASKLSMREAGASWVEAVTSGKWDWKGRETQLLARLQALEVPDAGRALAAVMKSLSLPDDLSGPWAELVAYAGGAEEAAKVWATTARPGQSAAATVRGLQALLAAANRGVRPSGDTKPLEGLLTAPNQAVAQAALPLAGHWKMEALAQHLGNAVAGTNAALRTAAAEGLRALGGEAAANQVRPLLSPERPRELRLLALSILAKVRPAEVVAAAAPLLADASKPADALPVWRTLATADVGVAQKVAAAQRDQLSPVAKEAGLQAARELGRRGTALEEALKGKSAQQAAAAAPQAWAKLVQERGNAAKGELLYHSNRLNCVQCHQIGGAGGRLGPDMSTIGASAPLDYVIESVLQPAAKVKEGYHGVSYTLTDGGAMTGVPFEENATAVRIRVPGGLEMDVPKAKIKATEIVGSLMPAGLVDALSEEEKINLFAFLGSVGRPGAFDASNGGVARIWRILTSKEDALHGRSLAGAGAAYTLTDGRLLPEHWELPLAMAGSAGEVFAVAKFQLGAAARVNLSVAGGEQVWVDGLPFQPGAKAFEAGEHTVVVSVKPKSPPSVLKLTADNARFVTP